MILSCYLINVIVKILNIYCNDIKCRVNFLLFKKSTMNFLINTNDIQVEIAKIYQMKT